MTVSEWAGSERYVSEDSGSPRPGKWSNDLVPFAVPMMDACGLDHPARKVVIKGSAQVVKSEVGLNAVAHAICQHPSPILVLLPSLEEMRKYNRYKLQPLIDSTPAVGSRVLHAVSRDETGSTMFAKRFRGGFVQVANANSPKALQMISARLRIYEEVSGYALDVGGRGAPTTQADARSKAWQGRGEKVVYISTPGTEGRCRISEEYDASDRQRLYAPCPHCGHYQVLRFENMRPGPGERAEGAWFKCVANGCVIEGGAQAGMIAGAEFVRAYPAREGEEPVPGHFPPEELERWLARDAGGREPGFHVWQAYSPFVTWESTMREFLDARGDPIRLKAFWQQALGEAWREAGEAVEPDALLNKREPYRRGVVPARGVVLVAAADVQRDRIECDLWAFGPNRERWAVEHHEMPGRPDQDAPWAALDEVLARPVEHESGAWLTIERLAVDTGDGRYTNDVYRWARQHRMGRVVMPIKGVPTYNPSRPVDGPTYVEVTVGGRKLKRGVRLWKVAVDTFKSPLGRLLLLPRPTPEELAAGAPFPAGYVHVPEGMPDEWVRQLASERLVDRVNKATGRVRREWVKVRARNEAWDMAVYASAAAFEMGVDRWTPARWGQEIARRGLGPGGGRGASRHGGAGPTGPAGPRGAVLMALTPEQRRAAIERALGPKQVRDAAGRTVVERDAGEIAQILALDAAEALRLAATPRRRRVRLVVDKDL
jgi:phage terminase large subunit GpA-like protein